MNDPAVPIIGIFADDLTGALDAAAPFAARGYRTVVSSTWELPQGAAGAEVVSINLGTRHMDP
ncbi:MAG: four-carbon acid sugar kinase family protein, partial [Dehalococcoidia bacterium]